MTELDNTETTKSIERGQEPTHDDHKDIIWPTVVGIFVALALGWMICRYKCSSQERSPHVVRCCPKSLCKTIRLCFAWTFRSNSETEQQNPGSNMQMQVNKESTLEIPFTLNNSTNHRSSVQHSSQQWPTPFFADNNNQEQTPSFSVSVQSSINSTQPKRHPLRHDSILLETGYNGTRRDSSPWPFPTINANFHKQANEIKLNDVFFST